MITPSDISSVILPDSLRDIVFLGIVSGKNSDILSVVYIPTLFLAFYLAVCGLMTCGCILKKEPINISSMPQTSNATVFFETPFDFGLNDWWFDFGRKSGRHE